MCAQQYSLNTISKSTLYYGIPHDTYTNEKGQQWNNNEYNDYSVEIEISYEVASQREARHKEMDWFQNYFGHARAKTRQP